jgi:hypothetical protein
LQQYHWVRGHVHVWPMRFDGEKTSLGARLPGSQAFLDRETFENPPRNGLPNELPILPLQAFFGRSWTTTMQRTCGSPRAAASYLPTLPRASLWCGILCCIRAERGGPMSGSYSRHARMEKGVATMDRCPMSDLLLSRKWFGPNESNRCPSLSPSALPTSQSAEFCRPAYRIPQPSP